LQRRIIGRSVEDSDIDADDAVPLPVQQTCGNGGVNTARYAGYDGL